LIESLMPSASIILVALCAPMPCGAYITCLAPRSVCFSAVGVLTCGWFLSRQYVLVFYVLIAMGACGASINAPPEKLQSSRTDVAWICGLVLAGLVLVNFSIRTMAVWGG
jgi:hypothetical protein